MMPDAVQVEIVNVAFAFKNMDVLVDTAMGYMPVFKNTGTPAGAIVLKFIILAVATEVGAGNVFVVKFNPADVALSVVVTSGTKAQKAQTFQLPAVNVMDCTFAMVPDVKDIPEANDVVISSPTDPVYPKLPVV